MSARRAATSVASLCRRAAASSLQRPHTTTALLPSAGAAGARPVVTAATAGAAAGGTMMKVMGVDVPYAYVIGTALAVGFGAYTYEYLVVAKEQNKPLQEEVFHKPDIRSLKMTDHNGQPFTASQISGKWALLDFGSLGSAADVKGINLVCRATESATQRTGATIVPLYLSLDPRKDTPADLKRVAQAAGHPAFAALTGDADGVLECAHKFKSQQKAAVLSSVKGDDKYKHGDSMLDETYVSSFVYLVGPSGEFSRLWPKDVSMGMLSDAVAQAVKQ